MMLARCCPQSAAATIEIRGGGRDGKPRSFSIPRILGRGRWGLKDAEPLWKGLGLGDRWREVLETGSWLRGWEKRFGTEVESREGERRVPGIAAMGEGKGW